MHRLSAHSSGSDSAEGSAARGGLHGRPGDTVRDLIDRQADAHPDQVFLVCPTSSRSVTYRQLHGSAARLAAGLQAQGCARGDRIALLLENGLCTAQLFLGLMYGGFVPVPLNVTSGASALSSIIRFSGARALYADPQHPGLGAGLSPGGACPVPTVPCTPDTPMAELCGRGGTLPELEADDDAVLDFTSGSTGIPKGVVATHRNLLAGASNTVAAHSLTDADRTLCVLPLYHMNAQVVTLVATLMSGGSVVMPRRFEANLFWQWLAEHRCTWCALVPSMISQLLAMPKAGSRLPADALSSLRFLRCSSAPLAVSHHERFEEQFRIPLLEAMGSTEAGGAIFSNPLPPAARRFGSVGKPWGFEVRIVGDGASPEGAFEEGDIEVRGPSVMKHYYNDPAGTSETITADGWLKIGDRGYRDDRGFYFITGRGRELINKGGEKIAPREIDEVISRLHGVTEVATVGVPDPQLGEDIVAYVVPRSAAEISEDDVLRHCERELGLLKTPRRVVFVDTLPKGPTGKVQRLRLADRFAAGASPAPRGGEPSPLAHAELVRRLAAVWAQVLGRDGVGPSDSFFDLGGHSLLAVRLLSRIAREFSVKLPLAALFVNPTVDGLAQVIGAMGKGLFPTPLAPVRGGGAAPPFFAVYGMENILVFRRLASRLKQDQPFFALPAHGLDASDRPYPNLEALAATYLRMIKSVQPRGPYFLGGRCFGGPVALEIAQQLLRGGEEVALLVIFDSNAPRGLDEAPASAGKDRSPAPAPLGVRLYGHLRGGTLPTTLLRFVLHSARQGSRRIASSARYHLSGRSTRYLLRVRDANLSLRGGYRADLYPRRITLIRSEGNVATTDKDHHIPRWRRLAGAGLEVHTVPGSHSSMFDEPHVGEVARLLQQCIQKARGAP